MEEVADVKIGIFEHFWCNFRKDFWRRPTIEPDFTRKRISDQDNALLISPFSEEEIKEAVWSCESAKSPGPDGFNFGFFKEFWHVIKDDLLRMMEEFHVLGKLVKGINSSFVVLILKKEAATRLNDYRPIHLIGGIYKIVSKILANRLSKVFDSIISET